MRIILIVLLSLLTICFNVESADLGQEKRYALLIGNSDYSVGRLDNPVNDATDMAALLEQRHFKVSVLTNANKRRMKQAINEFTRHLYEKEAVGLFYYAGHAVEVDGRNYLIPINASIHSETDAEYEAVDAGRVLGGMRRAGNNLNMIILDACRNNPFARSFRNSSRGLAQMFAPKGSLVLYATSPGDVASDGKGRNGLFTHHLMESIKQPGLKVEDVFKRTAIKVANATNEAQIPWQSGVMLGDFYFSGGNSKSNKANSDKVYFTVKTSPADARVRILNIVPKYKPGIELNPGRYQIEVSKQGFKRHLESVTLEAGIQVYSVVLQEKTVTASAINTYTDKNSRVIEPKMVAIPAGSFQMGSPDSELTRMSDERRHKVRVGAFELANYEVTVGEFRQFVLDTGYRTEAEKDVNKLGCYSFDQTDNKWDWRAGRNWDNPGFQQTNSHPVVCVSWNDIQAYIQWLNQHSTGGYRLPTEAEWEYAARAGAQTAYFWSDAVDDKACRFANVSDSNWTKQFPCNDGFKFTAPVGRYRTNKFGLNDIIGNVWEWICSEYDKTYSGAERECISKKQANRGVIVSMRGGSFFSGRQGMRLANRGMSNPWIRSVINGFRLARTR